MELNLRIWLDLLVLTILSRPWTRYKSLFAPVGGVNIYRLPLRAPERLQSVPEGVGGGMYPNHTSPPGPGAVPDLGFWEPLKTWSSEDREEEGGGGFWTRRLDVVISQQAAVCHWSHN